MIVHKCEQGSEAWHELRIGKFTASNFKDLMATKTTVAYKNIIARVAGGILSGENEDQYVSGVMERGSDLEIEGVRIYESTFDTSVERVGFVEPDEDDIFYGWVGVSPDGFVKRNGDFGLIEIKCPLIKQYLNYMKGNKVPSEYIWQVQGQLMVTKADFTDFVVYYPKLKPLVIPVEPDQEIQAQLTERLYEAIKEVDELVEMYKNFKYSYEPF